MLSATAGCLRYFTRLRSTHFPRLSLVFANWVRPC